ncbi:MAG: methylmalonyl-CoA mutase family protein [Planctomycetales bacterium]|nr:methylmalonyl-CoA mutase family protein [Planctomycetales bacterium]
MPEDDRDRFEAARRAWEETYRSSQRRREEECTTTSGAPVPPLGTPADVAGTDLTKDIGFPGQFPFTRGIHATGYRGRLWTMRQFAGFGTARDTNKRYLYLLEHGQTGLSVAFDMPTLMGYDPGHARSEGEVGRCGVSVACLEDMETLFREIPLGEVSVSMTINCTAPIIFAFFLAVAEKQGVPFAKLRGTLQNDILKEYIAQKEWIFPPRPSLKLVLDIVEYCTRSVPQWNSISISGYHIREAGSTALQELAFTLADGFAYVDEGLARGMTVDDFAPRLSYFWNSHNDFFEEIAKFRAARRIWARHLRDRYAAKDPRSWMCRFHTQTAGCSLTAQQPEVNIVRTAYQALAAVLGGTQSLHTNSMDETLALPTEKAVTIALRTQQVLAHETGVANTVDPFGGSWFVERFTDDMERGAEDYFGKIAALGGVVPAIEKGFFQREIAAAASRYQQETDRGDRVIVGVNRYQQHEARPIEIMKIDRTPEKEQREHLAKIRRRRDAGRWKGSLEAVRDAARRNVNLMPSLLDAVKADATLGEIVDVLRAEYGEYREAPVF